MRNGFPSLLRSGLSHNNRGQDGVDHRIHLLMMHKSIQHTVRYTELAFKSLFGD